MDREKIITIQMYYLLLVYTYHIFMFTIVTIRGGHEIQRMNFPRTRISKSGFAEVFRLSTFMIFFM
jgi:hypothetical protein